MKVFTKIIVILMVTLLLVLIVKPVYADIDVFNGIKDRIDQKSDIGQEELAGVGAPILAFIRNFALVLGVVMLSIIGIKYMLGSAEEKASYKKSLIPLVVGIIIVLSATVLVSVVYDTVVNTMQQESEEGTSGGGGSGTRPPTDPHISPELVIVQD